VIHVLVRLPESELLRLIKENVNNAQTKQQLLDEMKHKGEKAKQEADRVARIPPKRKRGWDKLNKALESKRGKDGNTAFSAMEYEQLPKRFRTDDGPVDSGPFFDLITNAAGIKDKVLDDIMSTIELKNWVYKNLAANEATRIQFMSAVFEHVVHMFKNDSERVVLEVEAELVGKFVRSNGLVDFLIRRGKKAVCIVEAKDENFKKGAVQSILGMEVTADINNEEHVYGVVTNFSEWRFLKRTDDGIESFTDINDQSRTAIARIAGRLHAILADKISLKKLAKSQQRGSKC
jgi:hypothetical protein